MLYRCNITYNITEIKYPDKYTCCKIPRQCQNGFTYNSAAIEGVILLPNV